MKKLVIIPAFNESASIERAVDDIRQNAPGFDYIVINDCSTDDTLKVCRKNGIKHVNLSVNLGIGGAVQTGYLYGCQNGYDLAVQFDGDGQHDASYLEQMAEELERTGSDMVIGSRLLKGRISVIGTAPCGNPLFLSSDQTDDRKAGDRSHFRYAYGEPSGYGDLRTELSEGLSGAGECDGNPQNGQESHGASGSYERKGRGQLFYRRI